MLSAAVSTLRGVRIGPVCVVVAVACVTAFAGCGSDEGGEPGASPTPSASAAATRLPDGFVYSRGGGIAGRSYRLTVAPDATATLETPGGQPKRLTLSADEVTALAGALTAADLPSQPAEFAPDRPVADGFSHRLQFGGDTITVQDGGDAPEPVKVLIARLSSVVDDNAG